MAMPDPSASLRSEQRAIRSLLDLLQQEQSTLIEAAIDGLADLTQAKAALVSELGVLAKSRHAALGATGFSANESGMRDWLAKQRSGNSEAEWNALLTMTTEAKELNRINGMLISRHLLRNQTELNILQGKPQSGGFYGPDGQSTAKGIGRGLGIG